MQVDVTSRLPRPHVVEQDEDSVQDDQVGHDCVLHGSNRLRNEEDPRSSKTNNKG